MELSDLEISKGVVSLYPRESLEDVRHPIHTRSGGPCRQYGHEERTSARGVDSNMPDGK
jgi:hypothetical protein